MLKLVPRSQNEKIVANLLGHFKTKRRNLKCRSGTSYHILSCVNSSGIALIGISPNTSSAYEEKKLAQSYTHLSHRKKTGESGGLGAYI